MLTISRGPKRKARASSGESCVQPNMEELQPSSSDLRQRLTAAEKEKAPKLSTFQEILRYIDENDKSSLRKETQFALLREKLAGAMRNRKASPLQKTEPGKALIDCIFEFHSNDTHNLHDQLDKSAEQIVDSGKKILTKAAWKMRVTASTASLVARLTKSRYTKTGDKTKEQYIRHNEKLPQILYRVIDELVPAYGVRAFAFFAAIHSRQSLKLIYFYADRSSQRQDVFTVEIRKTYRNLLSQLSLHLLQSASRILTCL